MKFIHLSDLHIGRSLNGFSLLEDQKYILAQILEIIRRENVESVIIAGDIYDKTTPLGEAITVFDEFITALADLNLPTFIISGNHDSAKRLSFAYRLIEKSNIHLAPSFDGHISTYTLNDDYGTINIYALPFLKGSTAREFFPEQEIKTHHDAVQAALGTLNLNHEQRHILIAHQFITGALANEQESSVGGAENIGIELFDGFDYVALGHLHAPQKLKYEHIRYAGSPLKYSLAEIKQEKSVTIVDLKDKGNLQIYTVPLIPLHDLREIKGTYDELTNRANYEHTNTQDYLRVVLTDEDDIINALAKLRTIYPNIMELVYSNKRTNRANVSFEQSAKILSKSPLELFENLYRMQNNQDLTVEQRIYLTSIIDKLWEVN